MTKKQIDWEAVELDYRAGIKTLRMMAADHGVSHVSIQKHATKHDWSRDLEAKIRQKTEALATRMVATKETTKEKKVAEKDVVMANAEMRVSVMMRHKKDFRRLQDMCESMVEELVTQSICKQEITRLAEIVSMASDGDQESADSAMKTISKTLGLANRADIFKKLIDAKKSLTALEREVLGLDDKSKDKDEVTTYNMNF